MKTQVLSGAFAALFGAALVTAQAPASGPSLQAAADPRYKSVIDTCKTPPPAPAARGGGPLRARAARRAAPAAPAPGAATGLTAIPGVIDAGQKWTKVWETSGNNADGLVGTPDGGLLDRAERQRDGPQAGQGRQDLRGLQGHQYGRRAVVQPQGLAVHRAARHRHGSLAAGARTGRCWPTGSTAILALMPRRGDQRHHRRQQGRRLLHDGRAVLRRLEGHRDALWREPSHQRRVVESRREDRVRHQRPVGGGLRRAAQRRLDQPARVRGVPGWLVAMASPSIPRAGSTLPAQAVCRWRVRTANTWDSFRRRKG